MSSSESTSKAPAFDALGLSPFLLRDLTNAGFHEPTPIQVKANTASS